MQNENLKIVIKNPSHPIDHIINSFPLDSTFFQLKERLREEYHGNPDPSIQRIIHKGSIPKDNETLRNKAEVKIQ